MEVKGSPATLAKPMTKPDKRAKQIVEQRPSIFAKCKTRLRLGRKIQPNSHNTMMNEKSFIVCEKDEEQKNKRVEERGLLNEMPAPEDVEGKSLLNSVKKTKLKTPKRALFDDIPDDESEASIEVLARYMGCTDQVYGEQPTISVDMTSGTGTWYYTVRSGRPAISLKTSIPINKLTMMMSPLSILSGLLPTLTFATCHLVPVASFWGVQMTMKKRMKRWTAWCTNPYHDIWRVDDYW